MVGGLGGVVGRERERERAFKKMLICMVKDGCIDEDSEESWADL